MTDDEHTSNDEYRPEETHYCDGDLEYETRSVTLPLSSDDNTLSLGAECTVCGRDVTVDVAIDVTMLRVLDSDTGTVLHEY